MTAIIERRLERLERAMGPSIMVGLASMIKAGRERAMALTPAGLAARREARLADMQARHVIKPLRGLEHRIMRGLERVVAHTGLTL